VNADWRGRIYTQSFYISYQGSDLASALINFDKGQVLNEVGKIYLYIYGANNHNENNISKCSFDNRIEWVELNYAKIISLDKDLILSAENPFLFISFCIIMRNINSNPNYLVKLPIFLDATCNGIQHLAAILQDLELGTKVNLASYDESKGPNDIYSELIDPINNAINKYGEDNIS
jgi:DNA-directed RNA polymerase